MGFKSYFVPKKVEKAVLKLKEEDPSQAQLYQDSLQPLAPAKLLSAITSFDSSLPSPWPSPFSSPFNSRPSSRQESIYPGDEYGNGSTDDILDIKSDVMVNWLHSRQEEHLWTAGEPEEGICLKKSRGQYACAPQDLSLEPVGFYAAIKAMNVKVAMTVNTRVIKILLRTNNMPYVEIEAGLRIQVLPDITFLPRAQKHQFAAFIAQSGTLVVWDDNPKAIIARVEKLEKALMEMFWQEETGEDENEKSAPQYVAITDQGNQDTEAATASLRPTMILQAILSACTLAITVTAIGSGWRYIALECLIDGTYIRAAFAICAIPQMWLSLFFFQALVGNIAQIIGPVNQMQKNSKYYSAVPPCRLNRENGALPHITVQCPVYKEGLTSVIEPTIRSIKEAISTYELQGGTANIFVNDDGMQLISEEEARQRQEFYDEHSIGWVARPGHDPKGLKGPAFTRAGKFKKASNMNYAMWVSQRMEDRLLGIPRYEGWSQEDESVAYVNALSAVVGEDEGRTWADGNIRMGDYILIIDSDTRVPTDCLLDPVSEMEQSPEVGIIQMNSGVMNVTQSFFERGITFFTNLVYTQISYSVSNGDVAPFVGHNAFLRWSAVQNIGYDCPIDHREKYWSEETVSEDFDMALRLQTFGYIVRYGKYFGGGFKEGVSLTVYDELARWEKYAYGCNELMFWPVKYWFSRGPFTPLFRRFIKSAMPLPSKLTIMAYIGTYYAIASAWLLTLLNYFVIGWFNSDHDKYYVDSFKIYFGIICVFTALGNLALAILRYRIEEGSIFGGIWMNIKWIPLLIIFLGGSSLHVSQAILSHMFGFDMSWGATAKEVENVTFFEEIPRVIKRFKFTFIFCLGCAAMMIVLSHFAPPLWRINTFTAMWPLVTLLSCHFFLPIALNPSLMLLTW